LTILYILSPAEELAPSVGDKVFKNGQGNIAGLYDLKYFKNRDIGLATAG